jgi:hypothetical protein
MWWNNLMKFFLLLMVALVAFFFLISSTLSCASTSSSDSILYPDPEVHRTLDQRVVVWDLKDPYHCEELYPTVIEYEEHIAAYIKEEEKGYKENISKEEARKRRYLNDFMLKYYDKCWEYVLDIEEVDM